MLLLLLSPRSLGVSFNCMGGDIPYTSGCGGWWHLPGTANRGGCRCVEMFQLMWLHHRMLRWEIRVRLMLERYHALRYHAVDRYISLVPHQLVPGQLRRLHLLYHHGMHPACVLRSSHKRLLWVAMTWLLVVWLN